jgi:hypothetical protein
VRIASWHFRFRPALPALPALPSHFSAISLPRSCETSPKYLVCFLDLAEELHRSCSKTSTSRQNASALSASEFRVRSRLLCRHEHFTYTHRPTSCSPRHQINSWTSSSTPEESSTGGGWYCDCWAYCNGVRTQVSVSAWRRHRDQREATHSDAPDIGLLLKRRAAVPDRPPQKRVATEFAVSQVRSSYRSPLNWTSHLYGNRGRLASRASGPSHAILKQR